MLDITINEPDRLVQIAHALSTRARVDILRLLNAKSLNVIEISEALQLPVSTVANHVKLLEAAKLIHTELLPATRGAMKVCSRSYDDILITLNTSVHWSKDDVSVYEVELPIGQYSNCEVHPTCGQASAEGMLIREDEPASFYHPNHVGAQLIWFRKGYLDYLLPLELPKSARPEAIEFSMELCSEAPNFDNDWPSDITLWINDVEIGTWTSPGDFGDRRGKLNPDWWIDWATQYGLLKTWRVDKERTTIDMDKVSDVSLADLALEGRHHLKLRIGIKSDALHKGGINLFGRQFGDYPQDIVMKVHYVLADPD
ncbi:ArsR/SmtB family transcription factor [Paenibacillus pasadenensis]|uniref:Transcriptional regulator n=1 Tax=Paenibacillus pasadenensis TaxID=217090 RepID=A0A2N5N1Z0_9BACL|nr:ArsR family transcriptional regulator [Paenibacillus pasadenensis]PLT44360.1 transcriptional regulator [Paenibacillus pasadenensis]